MIGFGIPFCLSCIPDCGPSGTWEYPDCIKMPSPRVEQSTRCQNEFLRDCFPSYGWNRLYCTCFADHLSNSARVYKHRKELQWVIAFALGCFLRHCSTVHHIQFPGMTRVVLKNAPLPWININTIHASQKTLFNRKQHDGNSFCKH